MANPQAIYDMRFTIDARFGLRFVNHKSQI